MTLLPGLGPMRPHIEPRRPSGISQDSWIHSAVVTNFAFVGGQAGDGSAASITTTLKRGAGSIASMCFRMVVISICVVNNPHNHDNVLESAQWTLQKVLQPDLVVHRIGTSFGMESSKTRTPGHSC